MMSCARLPADDPAIDEARYAANSESVPRFELIHLLSQAVRIATGLP